MKTVKSFKIFKNTVSLQIYNFLFLLLQYIFLDETTVSLNHNAQKIRHKALPYENLRGVVGKYKHPLKVF